MHNISLTDLEYEYVQNALNIKCEMDFDTLGSLKSREALELIVLIYNLKCKFDLFEENVII